MNEFKSPPGFASAPLANEGVVREEDNVKWVSQGTISILVSKLKQNNFVHHFSFLVRNSVLISIGIIVQIQAAEKVHGVKLLHQETCQNCRNHRGAVHPQMVQESLQ